MAVLGEVLLGEARESNGEVSFDEILQRLAEANGVPDPQLSFVSPWWNCAREELRDPARFLSSYKNPYKLTEENGAPDPHPPLLAPGEIELGWVPGVHRGHQFWQGST